jgi:chromosome segregation ATPase
MNEQIKGLEREKAQLQIQLETVKAARKTFETDPKRYSNELEKAVKDIQILEEAIKETDEKIRSHQKSHLRYKKQFPRERSLAIQGTSSLI